MQIGIDIRSLIDTPVTGVGVYVRGVLEGLCSIVSDTSSDGYKLLSTGSRRPDISSLELPGVMSKHHRSIPNKVLAASWFTSGLPSLRSLFPPIDYLWLPNVSIVPFRHTQPYAITVHDLSFEHNPRWFSVQRRLWHRAVRADALFAYADRVITVSEATAVAVRSLHPQIARERIIVIPPALSHCNNATMPLGSSVLKGVKEYILYIGTLEPRKNIEAVGAAFQMLQNQYPNLHLVIAGHFGWSIRKTLRILMQDERIHWLGYVSQEQKHELLRCARLLVWPSYYEGFGFPPLEALRGQVPVITSNRTSLPEMLRQHALYVNPYNVGELAKSIDQVLAATQVAHHLRRIPPVFEHRTWENVAMDYFTLFKESYENRN